MVEFMNWVLLLAKNIIVMLIGFTSIDGYSFGHMIIGVAIIGTVLCSTIGAVALVSRQIKDNSYADTHAVRAKQSRAELYKRLDERDD